MPFRTKIQPININVVSNAPVPYVRQAPMFRLKRLFKRPFSLKNLSGVDLSRDNSEEVEPSSVCLRKMVERYIEDPDIENQPRCFRRNPCNCLSGSGIDSSDEEEKSSSNRVLQSLKNLLLCANVDERDLETKTTMIINNEEMCKNLRLQVVVDELVALGYDAAVCRSSWEKSKSKSCHVPAGEYEYVDVMIGNQRILIDIDFQSKFNVVRQTKTFKSILQTLPYIFVGQLDRLKKVVTLVSKVAGKSLKKKGLYVPPWRRAEYMLTRWVSHYDRAKHTQRETSGEDGAIEP